MITEKMTIKTPTITYKVKRKHEAKKHNNSIQSWICCCKNRQGMKFEGMVSEDLLLKTLQKYNQT